MASCALCTVSCSTSLSVPLRILLCHFAMLVFQYHIAALIQVPCRGVRSHRAASIVLNSDGGGGAAISCRSNKE